MRKLHIDGQEWKYKIYSYSAVIRDPNNKKHVVHLSILLGTTVYAIEHDSDKRNLHITPSQVKTYIQEHLVGV